MSRLRVFVRKLFMRMCLTEAAVSPGMVGEHTNGSYVVICMLMCVGEESTGAGPCFHRALLPEQPPESCWWFAKHVTCSLMRQLTRRRGGEGDKRVEVLKKKGRAHCSGELISSRGPLFILEGSMEPHCAWGFCSRWFFSIDFSPSAVKRHVGIMRNMCQTGCHTHESQVPGAWDMTEYQSSHLESGSRFFLQVFGWRWSWLCIMMFWILTLFKER